VPGDVRHQTTVTRWCARLRRSARVSGSWRKSCAAVVLRNRRRHDAGMRESNKLKIEHDVIPCPAGCTGTAAVTAVPAIDAELAPSITATPVGADPGAGTLADQALLYPVQRPQVELIRGLRRHELHGRALHRHGDCLGIAEVILLPLRVGANIPRRHQPGIVAQCP
jgi:hypothetical protein